MEKFTNQASLLVQNNFALLGGRTRYIKIRYTGVNAGGATAVVADFGSVVVQRAGKPQIFTTFADIADFNDYDRGANARASAIGAAFDFTFYIDLNSRLNADDTNAVMYAPTDYIMIPAVSAAVAASGTVKVCQYIDNSLPEIYVPNIVTNTEVLSAQKPIYLKDANLYRVKLNATGGAATLITLTRDGETITNLPYLDLQNNTNSEGRIETAGSVLAAILNLGQLHGVTGTHYEMVYTGGTGTLVYTTINLDYLISPVKLVPQFAQAVNGSQNAGYTNPNPPKPNTVVSYVTRPGFTV